MNLFSDNLIKENFLKQGVGLIADNYFKEIELIEQEYKPKLLTILNKIFNSYFDFKDELIDLEMEFGDYLIHSIITNNKGEVYFIGCIYTEDNNDDYESFLRDFNTESLAFLLKELLDEDYQFITKYVSYKTVKKMNENGINKFSNKVKYLKESKTIDFLCDEYENKIYNINDEYKTKFIPILTKIFTSYFEYNDELDFMEENNDILNFSNYSIYSIEKNNNDIILYGERYYSKYSEEEIEKNLNHFEAEELSELLRNILNYDNITKYVSYEAVKKINKKHD